MTTGLVIGKFYPPHRGHKFLIDTARAQVDRLIVIVCHREGQTIPGELRKAWMEAIHPDCEIHLVPDELADESAPWAEFTLMHLGNGPDIVFTSESYGADYAGLIGAAHVMVDADRVLVPISGTMIRAAPLDHLDFLEPVVRAYYVRRVVLIGAESVGKTVLCEQLAAHYDTRWVPEYGREHWEKKIAEQHTPAGETPAWSDDEFVHIAEEQQRRENEAAGRANRVLICDTNAFATATWFERYAGTRHRQVDAIGARDKVDLYLIPSPDVPFVQDGVRDGEGIRHWMHARFLELIGAGETPYVLITGAWEDRLPQAIAAIDALLAEPMAARHD